MDSEISICVLDYGCGNLTSVNNICRHLGFKAEIISRPTHKSYSAIILPGVGSFDQGMTGLKKSGLDVFLIQKHQERVPILGICLGMQLLCRSSEEGVMDGLGFVDASVKRIPRGEVERQIPHLGWNFVSPLNGSLFQLQDRFYFAHSYYVEPDSDEIVSGVSDYKGFQFASSYVTGTIVGAQFHPEKSHHFGMRFLESVVTKRNRE